MFLEYFYNNNIKTKFRKSIKVVNTWKVYEVIYLNHKQLHFDFKYLACAKALPEGKQEIIFVHYTCFDCERSMQKKHR